MPKKNSSPFAGLTVRIPKDVHDGLRGLNSSLPGHSANRMMLRMQDETVQMTESYPFALGEAKLLRKMRADPEVRKRLKEIAGLKINREVTNDDTKAIKLPFSGTDRDQIKRISHDLGWSVAQVVLEAIQTFLVLGGANEPIEHVPALIESYRGIWTFRGRFKDESASLVVSKLNDELGFKPPPLSAPATVEPVETYLDLI